MNHVEKLDQLKTLPRPGAAPWLARCVTADRFAVATALVVTSSGLPTPIDALAAVERLGDTTEGGRIGLVTNHQAARHQLADPRAGANREQADAALPTTQRRGRRPTGVVITRPSRPEPDADFASDHLTCAASVRARVNAGAGEDLGA